VGARNVLVLADVAIFEGDEGREDELESRTLFEDGTSDLFCGDVPVCCCNGFLNVILSSIPVSCFGVTNKEQA
jgi:hypothetical protein